MRLLARRFADPVSVLGFGLVLDWGAGLRGKGFVLSLVLARVRYELRGWLEAAS